jgi:hypothetical protein
MGDTGQDPAEVIAGPPTANPRRTRVRDADGRARNHTEQELSEAPRPDPAAAAEPEER